MLAICLLSGVVHILEEGSRIRIWRMCLNYIKCSGPVSVEMVAKRRSVVVGLGVLKSVVRYGVAGM